MVIPHKVFVGRANNLYLSTERTTSGEPIWVRWGDPLIAEFESMRSALSAVAEIPELKMPELLTFCWLQNYSRTTKNRE